LKLARELLTSQTVEGQQHNFSFAISTLLVWWRWPRFSCGLAVVYSTTIGPKKKGHFGYVCMGALGREFHCSADKIGLRFRHPRCRTAAEDGGPPPRRGRRVPSDPPLRSIPPKETRKLLLCVSRASRRHFHEVPRASGRAEHRANRVP